jgi:hypothetical protein
MKKIFIVMLAMTSIVGAYAQQNSTTDDDTRLPYKLKKGSVTTELNFSPFSFNLNFDGENWSTGPLAMPGLRLRIGLSNKWALRTNVQLDFGHNKIQQNLDDIHEDYWMKQTIKGTRTGKDNYIQFSFAPGLECHFGKWERLSVYAGGEVLFGFKMAQTSYELEHWDELLVRDYYSGEFRFESTSKTFSSIKTKNCTYDSWDGYYSQTGKMFFGGNLLAGFDYYIYKGLYLGAELGLGYTHSLVLEGTVKGNIETTTTTSNGTTTDESLINRVFNDKITGGNLGFRCNPMIRLGWRF